MQGLALSACKFFERMALWSQSHKSHRWTPKNKYFFSFKQAFFKDFFQKLQALRPKRSAKSPLGGDGGSSFGLEDLRTTRPSPLRIEEIIGDSYHEGGFQAANLPKSAELLTKSFRFRFPFRNDNDTYGRSDSLGQKRHGCMCSDPFKTTFETQFLELICSLLLASPAWALLLSRAALAKIFQRCPGP